jgi:hypothetical protein
MATANDYDYLSDVASKYGEMYFVDELNDFVENLNREQLSELEIAYKIIRSKEDGFAISEWLQEVSQDERKRPRQEVIFARRVGRLFVLFARLADAGILPFSTREVRYFESVPKPDWSSLPEELGYLIEPAEIYGVHSSEQEIIDFLDAASEGDMQTLARVAEQIRLENDGPKIAEWIDQFPMDKHRESWLVYCLFGILDHAGFAWE